MQTLIIITGLIASATLVMSGLSTQRKRMLIFAVITSALCVVQYSLTGAALALIICAIGAARNLVALAALKKPAFNSGWFLALFLIAQSAAFVFTANWGNFQIVEALPLIGAFIGTTALFFKKMAVTKAMMIACGGVWIFYQYHTGVYGQMVGEGVNLVANSVALTMLLLAARKGVAETQVENVDTQILDVITTSIPVVQEKIRTAAIPVVRTITETIPTIAPSTGTVPISVQKPSR